VVGSPYRVRVIVTPHFAMRPEQLLRLSTAHPLAEIVFVKTQEEFAVALPECDAAITSFALPATLLATTPRLRWVQTMGAGVERFLTPALRQSTLTLTATKGPLSEPMAEHVITMMLALARRLPEFFVDQQQRRWRRAADAQGTLTEMAGKTMFVVGAGGVGGAVARICKSGLQMRVLGLTRTDHADPFVDVAVTHADLHQALHEADFVSISLPLTAATEALFNERAFAAMKRTAYLLNVSRGGIIDESALVSALKAGEIAGAGLDTVAVEPLSDSSPLWSLPNVIITPHTSALTDRLGDRFVDFWCENVRRFVEGEPLHGLVDKQAGY